MGIAQRRVGPISYESVYRREKESWLVLVVLYCTVVFIARRLVIYLIIIYRIHVPGGSCLHPPWSYIFTTKNLSSHNWRLVCIQKPMGEFVQGSQYSSASTSLQLSKMQMSNDSPPPYHLYCNLSFELVSGALDEAISASHCRQREMERNRGDQIGSETDPTHCSN